MDAEWERIGAESEGEPDSVVIPENLAYVIYTSGSTGRPKGVMITHKGLANYLHWASEAYRIEEGEGAPVQSSIGFDLTVTSLYGPLVNGKRVNLLPEGEGIEALATALRKERGYSLVKITPAHLEVLAQQMRNVEVEGRAKALVIGGEELRAVGLNYWQERAPGTRLINEYGPTETVVGCCVYEVNGVESGREVVPIGKPIANAQIYVLDRGLEPAPIGARGEIYVSGAGVARGYVSRAELTGEKFVPNRFGRNGGERVYRTGDLGRYLPDGKIEFIGRGDHQVKVRGYRIELGEIEAVLNEHRSVKQSVAVVREDERGGKRLLGYVVGEEGATTAGLKSYVRGRLPEYMVPEAIMILEEMPLTANGKIDRKKLPEVKDGGGQSEQEYAGARTPVEEIVIGIFEEVLKAEGVGRKDNFFEIGGHSLSATQVVSRVRNVFGVEIGVVRIFEDATVEGLARKIGEVKSEGRLEEAPPLVRAPRNERLPLSFAQERLWFIDQLVPNNPSYNVPRAVRLEGQLDLEALEQVINEIIRRHEVLRTRFEIREGQPAQIIDPWEPRRLERADLTSLTWEEREEETRRMVREEAGTGFDLRRGPLLKVKALTLEEKQHVALFTMHHIVSDAWSAGILIREVGVLYQAYSAGEPSPLEEVEIQYADYAVWQRNYLRGEVLERQLSYWREQLAGLEPLELPLDYPRPALAGYRGASLNFEPGEELTQGLRALSRREGVTLFMTLLAAFQTLLARYSGQEEISVGSTIANRTRAEAEKLIGFFTNTLVLRTKVEGELSFQELLERVREVCLGAYAYQDLPFEQLVAHLQPERDLSRQPLFQVMLTFQQAGVERLGAASLRLKNLEIPLETSKFDLMLSTAEMSDNLGCNFNYNRDLFEATTLVRMIEHFKGLLKSIVANPLTHLSDLGLLLPEERQQMLFEWSQTAVSFAPDRCIHQLFEEQVEQVPEAIAICFRDRHLSYQELNARANQMAYRLRISGVGPEKVVGLCSERSMEMLVSVLGILKAGGAYVPLDPGYPQERLSFMLKDSGVKALVTQKSIAPRFSQYEGAVMCLDEGWDRMPEESRLDSGVEMDWESPAYVIYTSGSTGKPKGVAMVHRAVTNLVRWQLDNPPLSFPQRTLQFTSLSFDVSFQEIFATWCTGGTLILIDEETRRDPVRLWEGLRENAVERLFLPFVALQHLAEAAELEGASDISLRRLITAGEALKLTPPVEKMIRGVRDCILENQYGPTESHVVTSYSLPQSTEQWVKKLPPIGRPIANTEVYILDNWMEPAPVGVVGDLYIGGSPLSRGYVNQPAQTAEKFIPNPFSERPGACLYLSGDKARYLPDGKIEFLGRRDDQVKVRGYRIELGEIEAMLGEDPRVRECAAAVRTDDMGDGYLVAYVVCQEGEEAPVGELRSFLRQRLPDYMVPSAIVGLEKMPLLPNGKIDRRALPTSDNARPALDATYVAPQTDLEHAIAAVWEELLQVQQVGIHDNFFDLGAHSLMMVRASSKLQDLLQRKLPVIKLFQYPTISALAAYLSQDDPDSVLRQEADFVGGHENSFTTRAENDWRKRDTPVNGLARNNGRRAVHLKRPSDIAIIGMSGRFPQAPTISVFWRNLCDAREAVSFLSDSQLLAAGVDPTALADPRYVKAAASIDGVDLFDASFFGFNPREAEILDPQHRLFLQSAWHALESAGYVPDRFPGLIGLFAGAGFHSYLLAALRSNPRSISTVGAFQTLISNDTDFLPTRVSYKLNLRGPSVAVQTACSTSLVAVHLACQSLLNGECDMALAGGVTIAIPQDTGYFYQTDGIASPDGHCRAFDARASGTISGSGLGIVVLKRLAEARADGDNILAVVKGSAINNDGSGKVGYTAPSINGQSQVIAEAQAIAGVDPATITYVEAHGTGTALGDPIEVAALTQAFRAATDKKGFCAVGSVKTNIGHLGAAAGVAGLIKTVMALKHRQIPASLHFERPNPQIDFSGSPFYVNTELQSWKTNGVSRRAGVSSFGIGGTNAHLILEEAPEVEPSDAAEGWQLLVLSARSERSLTAMATQLAEYLKQHPELNLADVAYTLQEGRKAFTHRLSLVCRDISEAITMLEEKGAGRRPYRAVAGERATPVVYMFPGQGTQYVGMGRELYEQEPKYRSIIDRCAEVMEEELGIDLRRVLYPSPEEEAQAVELINQTRVTQAALFAVELGLARMWQSRGVQPDAMIGHSLGEYVAGCLAGVMREEQAMKLVAKRGVLMQRGRPGAMLAVALSESELRQYLQEAGSRLEVAAINGPQQCVVSGEEKEIAEFERRVNGTGIASKRLKTSHAFHSRMMGEVLGEYEREVRRVELRRPVIPYISNVSGKWIRAEEAQEASYWSRQMREPVRYWEGLEQIEREIKERVLLEVGPGEMLSRLGRQLRGEVRQRVVATLGSEAEGGARAFMEAVGNLWANGVEIEWEKWRKGKRRRVELPGYVFEEEPYWIEGVGGRTERGVGRRKKEVGEWFYLPVWKEATLVVKGGEEREAQRWLVLEDEGGIGGRIVSELERQGDVVIRVKRAGSYERKGEREYGIRVGVADDYKAVLKELEERGELPKKIVHLFSLSREETKNALGWEERIEKVAEAGFYSLAYLAQGLGLRRGAEEMEVVVVSNGVAEVVGDEEVRAEKGLVIGPVRVMRQEYPHVKSRYIDVVIPSSGSRQEERLIKQLIVDLNTRSTDQIVAYRGNHRWAQTYEAARLDPAPFGAGLRLEGVYLITGGLGKIGMVLAEYLAHSVKGRLALTGREGLPERSEWDRLVGQAEADEEIRRKIRRIREMEAAGAEVEVIRADVSHEEEMVEAVRRTQQRFGPINGVIHAAGITDEQSIGSIQEIIPANTNLLFRPKVHGLFVLEKVFQDADLDFCLLLSSLSSVFGGLGIAAYTGSNICMDTFVSGRNRVSQVPWTSVNWDHWRFKEDHQSDDRLDSAQAKPGIWPEEGVDAFQRIISTKMTGQVIVSTMDLQSRIRQRIDSESLHTAQLHRPQAFISGHSRPELGTTYVTPRSDLERSIAVIWQDLLGIEQIGIHDSFFELGGHSLLAIQYLSRLRGAFQLEIPVRSLFEKPTIAEQSELIEEALIKEIESLTEEEVANLRGESQIS